MTALNGLLIVGCGKMGSAILNGLLKKGINPNQIRVVEPNEEVRNTLKSKGIKAFDRLESMVDFSPAVVFAAVKPFLIPEIVGALKPLADNGAVLLSIIAGRPLGFFEHHLGASAAVARAMPNTPAAIGKGITGVTANGNVSEDQKKVVQFILETCGEVVWLADEAQIDAVTAVSGSGPAYLFYLTEALAEAAKALNLPDQTAEKLARATVCGAAALMESCPDSPAVLRRNVTTPNGTTAAALEILEHSLTGLTPLMTRAVKAAEERSKQLGKS